MKFSTFSGRFSLRFKFLLGTLIVLLLVVAQVSAARMSCRSDPIVTLTDGNILQFSVDIATSRDEVIAIHYEVHVPVGVEAKRVIFTPNWARSKETVTIVPDQVVGDYQILTVVQTASPQVETTVIARLITRANQGIGVNRQEVDGVSGQTIRVAF